MGRPFFYGWIIIATLFMVNFGTMAMGTLNFGLFVLPMSDNLDLSRGFIGWSQTTRMLAGGVSGFFLGRLLDRHGSRALITVASLVTGLSMVGLAYIHEPWQFLLLFSIMGLTGLSAPGALLTSVPVAKWFVRKRGMALALVTMGLGTGGIAFMPLTQLLINGVGWRNTWLILAIISVSIIVPVTVLFLRRQPEDMGLYPDGQETESSTVLGRPRPRRQEPRWTVREALRTNAFWLLILYFALMGLAAGGGSIHRLPYWVEKGFDPQLVSYSFSADAAGAALMALAAGFLVDRFPVRFVAVASCFGFIGAILLMLMATNTLFLFASTTLFGLSVGINMIVTSFIWADYYGRAFLGTIRGIVLPASLIAAGVGAPVAGYIYDGVGNYRPVWWILIALYGLAALVVVNTVAPTSPEKRPAEES